MKRKTYPISTVLRAKHSVSCPTYIPVNSYIVTIFGFQRLTSFILWICTTIGNTNNRKIYSAIDIHNPGSHILFRRPKFNAVSIIYLIQHAPFRRITKLKSETAVLKNFPFTTCVRLSRGGICGWGRCWRFCFCWCGCSSLNRCLLRGRLPLFLSSHNKISTNSDNSNGYHYQKNVCTPVQ